MQNHLLGGEQGHLLQHKEKKNNVFLIILISIWYQTLVQKNKRGKIWPICINLFVFTVLPILSTPVLYKELHFWFQRIWQQLMMEKKKNEI